MEPGVAKRVTQVVQAPAFRALAALALVAATGFVFDADGAFYNPATHRDMLRQVSVYGILAAGMTLVIVSGGIDLSVGSVLGLSAVVTAYVCLDLGLPSIFGLVAAVVTGALCGALSGFLIAYVRLQPFLATLAMMVFARGLAKAVSGGQKLSVYRTPPSGDAPFYEVPALFSWLDTRILGDNLAAVTVVFLIVVALGSLVLGQTGFGRYLYAIGGNEDATRLSGIPVRRIKLIAYLLSGLAAGLAGACQAAQEQQGDPEAGFTYELTAIAMVVIGGTKLTGGGGGLLLTLMGVLTIGYVEKVLSINAVGEAPRLMLTGAIIVAAVAMQRRNP